MAPTLSSTKPEVIEGGMTYFVALILMSICCTSVRSLTTLAIFYVSYYTHKNNQEIPAGQSFFMEPIYSFLSLLTVPLSGYLQQKIGLRFTFLISFILIYIAVLLYLAIDSLFIFFIGIGLFGASVGLTSVGVKVACFFFPGKEGLISGIERTFSMSMIYIWYFAGDFIINNIRDKPDKKGIYEKDVAERAPIFTVIIGVSCLIGMAIFYGLTFGIKFRPVEEKYKAIMEKIAQEQKDTDNVTETEIAKELTVEEQNQKKKRELKQIFSSWDFWKIFVISIFIVFTPLLITCTFKVFGSKSKKIDENVITLQWTISGVVGSLINPLYGYLYDKIGFRPLFMLEGIGLAAGGALFVLSLITENAFLFSLSLYLNNISVGVYNSCVFPHVVKIFGMDHVMDLFGVIGLTIGLLGFAASGSQYIITEIIDPKSNALYYIAFAVGILFEILCVIMAAFEKSNKFEYKNDYYMMEHLVDSKLFKEPIDESPGTPVYN